MDTQELIEYYPILYHMADDSSWDGLQQQGLLSTASLVDLFQIPEPRRSQLLMEHRPQSVIIEHPVYGRAVIRDQKPLQTSKLQRLLIDMDVPDWIRLLNGYVFFWLHPERLERLLNARAYRDRAHLVLTVSTKSLVASYEDRIFLSRINSGATYVTGMRGSATFQRISDCKHPRSRLVPPNHLVELAIIGGVPDILEHTIKVERRHAGRTLETVFEK
jgi:hypothetical protein